MQNDLQKALDDSEMNMELLYRLGKGAFGDVWAAKLKSQNHLNLAIKFEKSSSKYSTLQKEVKIMLMLKEGFGFPKPKQYRSTATTDILAMDRLGPNLEKLLRYCQGTFSLKTGLLLLD